MSPNFQETFTSALQAISVSVLQAIILLTEEKNIKNVI